jgi:hypothetical protein
VLGVLDVDRRGLVAGVAVEVRADEVAVPAPVVLRVGCGVHSGVTAAGLDVVLERRLLLRVEHVAGGREEHDRVVLGELRGVELRRVLGRVDGEGVGGAERLDGGDPGRDRVVPEACGLREDQHLRIGGLGARGRDRDEQRGHDCQQQRDRKRTTHFFLPLSKILNQAGGSYSSDMPLSTTSA